MVEQSNKITEGVIWKQILIFCFPILVGGFFQQCYTLVDAMVVGRGLGTLELAAVGGSATKLINTVTNFFIGISIGITSYTARSCGEGDFNKLRDIILNGFFLFIPLATLISVSAWLLTPQFLTLMGTPEDSFALSQIYLRTYMGGIVFCVVYNLLSATLIAMGDAKNPLYILIFCCFLNIFLDIFLALHLHWGVFGVAFATVASQFSSAILLVKVFLKEMKEFPVYQPKIKKTMLKNIAILGIPAGIQSTLSSITNMIVQSVVNSFQTNTVAAWAAFLRIDGAIDLVLVALSGTVVTFVGQNLGAKKFQRVKQSVNQTMSIAFVAMGFLTAFFLWFRVPVLSLFTDDPEVLKIGESILFVALTMYICAVPNYIYAQALRGLGKSIAPMLIGLFGSIVVRLTWVYVVFPWNPTIEMLALSFPVIMSILSVIFYFYYKIVWKEKSESEF